MPLDRWNGGKVPALAVGPQHDFTGQVQITYYPKLRWQR